MNNLFSPQHLIGREVELQAICQILAQDGDFSLIGAPGIGRRTLIQAAAHQVGARVIEIDCLRTTSANRFLRLLADGITDGFSRPAELALIRRWSAQQPFVLEQTLPQRPHLAWHQTPGKDWSLFQTLLALPQILAESLDCRVVIVFLNFPHIRSWDRSGEWENYLRQEIHRQSRVSYALVSTVVEPWVQQSKLPVIALAPLHDEVMKSWLVPAMAVEGLQFDADPALNLFLEIVQGHLGAALTLARRIWFDRRALGCLSPDWEPKRSGSSAADAAMRSDGRIEAHHVHRSTLALVEDLAITFESLILLLPPNQVRVLESLALDPTDKPQSRDYIQKHQLSRGGSLQGALSSLEQKGLVYGPQYSHRVALPFLAFWLKQRLS